jgi:hypothetical protein
MTHEYKKGKHRCKVGQLHSQSLTTSIYSIHQLGLYYTDYNNLHHITTQAEQMNPEYKKTKVQQQLCSPATGLHSELQATKLLVSLP